MVVTVRISVAGDRFRLMHKELGEAPTYFRKDTRSWCPDKGLVEAMTLSEAIDIIDALHLREDCLYLEVSPFS